MILKDKLIEWNLGLFFKRHRSKPIQTDFRFKKDVHSLWEKKNQHLHLHFFKEFNNGNSWVFIVVKSRKKTHHFHTPKQTHTLFFQSHFPMFRKCISVQRMENKPQIPTAFNHKMFTLCVCVYCVWHISSTKNTSINEKSIFSIENLFELLERKMETDPKKKKSAFYLYIVFFSVTLVSSLPLAWFCIKYREWIFRASMKHTNYRKWFESNKANCEMREKKSIVLLTSTICIFFVQMMVPSYPFSHLGFDDPFSHTHTWCKWIL